MLNTILDQDLEHILFHTRNLWDDFHDENIFITGGTGFFGTWILHTLARANEKLKLNNNILVLSRSPKIFLEREPFFYNNKYISFHPGDIQDFVYPKGTFTHIIHTATPASASLNSNAPRLMFDTAFKGTEHTLEFARQSGAHNILFTSSGAIYGRQPSEITHISEDYLGGPDPLSEGSAYAEGKRAAEFLCAQYYRQFGLDVKIARCFAFVGPYLPIDKHFAIGNFIRDALHGGPIIVNGDGTPHRSYLYSADLIIWLLTIFIKGVSCRAYNVGSEESIPISNIAEHVSRSKSLSSKMAVKIAKSPEEGKLVERYVPSTQRAFQELGLKQLIDFDEAIHRTIEWNKSSAIRAS